MKQENREQLRNTISSFLEEDIDATNQPVSLDNGVKVLLKHWVKTHENLGIELIIPERAAVSENPTVLSEENDTIQEIVSEVNSLLESEGLETPEKYILTQDEGVERLDYRFEGKNS